MDQLTELLEGIGIDDVAERTDEEIVERGEAIRALLPELREQTGSADKETADAAMAALEEAVGAIEFLEGIAGERLTEREEREAKAAELLARVAGPEDEPEDEPEPEVPGVTAEAEAEVVAEAEQVIEDAPEAVAASAPPRRVPLGSLAPRRPRDLDIPAAPAGNRLVAGADIPNRPATSEFTGWEDVGDAMIEKAKSFFGAEHYGSPQKIRIGSEIHTFAEDRLVAGAWAPERNTKVVQEAIGRPGTSRAATLDSLVAAGICGPVNVEYRIETLGDAGRPLANGLPSFQASRGGIEFRRSLGLASIVVNNTDGAIDTITTADPNATKTIQTVACQTTATVNVEAITSRLKFDNWMQLYDPETMNDAIQLARVAHARAAERRILALIDAGSTQQNVINSPIGFLPNAVGIMVSVASRMRRRHRLADDATISAVIPSYFTDASLVDAVNQHAGDDVWSRDPSDFLGSKLAQANIVPIYQRDGLDDTTGMATAAAAGVQTAADFPQTAEIYMFPVGTWVHLDGGQLDFGIVRDSTLNATNQLETFFESFESAARLGIDSIAIGIPVCPSGARALDIANDCGGIGS